MREILFRAKNSCGIWVYGYYVFENGEHFIYEQNKPHGASKIVVDPDTVGQYIGLEDRKGNKVFEHDTVEYRNNAEHGIGEIEWINGGFVFMWLNVENDIWTDARHFGCKSELKIIGTVHDNPELLDKQNEIKNCHKNRQPPV